jgi:hypothetical protein
MAACATEEAGEQQVSDTTCTHHEEVMENPYPTQVLARVDFIDDYSNPVKVVDDIEVANVATSRVRALPEGEEAEEAPEFHKPLLDIDMPVTLIPSSTPGHYHLLIDHEMSWSEYASLMRALAEAGILEQGYVMASLERGFSAVRLPWIAKED